MLLGRKTTTNKPFTCVVPDYNELFVKEHTVRMYEVQKDTLMRCARLGHTHYFRVANELSYYPHLASFVLVPVVLIITANYPVIMMLTIAATELLPSV